MNCIGCAQPLDTLVRVTVTTDSETVRYESGRLRVIKSNSNEAIDYRCPKCEWSYGGDKGKVYNMLKEK